MTVTGKTVANGRKMAKRKESIFLFFFLLFPIVQFLIFYVGVNFNSILLAFQRYEVGTGFVMTGFENFKEVWNDIFNNGALSLAIKNSFTMFLVNMFLGTPVHIMVAYAIFKKIPFADFFKVMLFMPSMISAMVFVLCAKALFNDGFPILFNDPNLFILNKYSSDSFTTVLWFGFWMGFAGGLIIYLSAMASISTDIIEYGKLENLSSIQELWYVVIPSIFPTITTYVVVGLAGFFTNQGYFYSFFGGDAAHSTPFDTLGYLFFIKVGDDNATQADYPYAAAGGLLFTMIVAPITLITKALLEKYGPGED